MNRRLFGAFGALTVVAFGLGSCKSDPLSDLDGKPAALVTDFSFVEVTIGNSQTVTAKVLDARSAALPVPITFTACDNKITVAPDPDFHPVPVTSARALITGQTFGTSCVVVQSEGFTDTVDVATFPVRVVVTGPDTIGSGATVVYTFQYQDEQGNPVAGVPDPVFSSSDTTKAKLVPGAPLGTFAGLAPGAVTIQATGTGSPEGGVVGTKAATVAAGAFLGTVSPTSGSPTDTITLSNAAGGPGFDADTRVFINGVRAFTFAVTTASIKAVVPGMGAAGPVTLSLENMGPAQVAQKGTFTSNTALFADKFDATNDDPATAPTLTLNGDYYVVQHGTCKDGAVTDPGDDCDDFFKVSAPAGTGDSLTVNIAWFDGSDVDILWCRNVGCTSVTTGGGATAANPENSTVVIPAGATWYLWINYFESGGPSTLVRVRLTNKN